MRSKTSFFDKGIFKNLLHRFWPLWTAYLLIMLFVLPVSLGSQDFSDWERISQCGADSIILRHGINFTRYAFLAAGISAMAVFSHLFQSKSCGMMAALPIRRESMFLTAYLAGLLPMLAANCIAALMAMLLGLGNVYIHAGAVLQWLALVSLNIFSFYSFAALCAMLTGSVLVMLPVYAVLELTAYALQMAVEYLLQLLSYGFTVSSKTPTVFSPLASLMERLRIESSYTWILSGSGIPGDAWYVENEVHLLGWGYVIGYALAGIVFAAAALLLYRRRNMESAGDTVAIPVLKPVFRYCLSLGCALVIPEAVYSMFFELRMGGPARAVFLITAGLLCAIAGWYIADMIIQRSFRVFPGKPAGLCIVCGFFLALCLCVEFDIPGLERKVPELSEVESVRINTAYATREVQKLYDPENIAAAEQLHRELIAAKPRGDGATGMFISIDYTMKDGSTLGRVYRLNDENVHQMAIDILNSPEAILHLFPTDEDIGPDTLTYSEISYMIIDPETGTNRYLSATLDKEQAWALYCEGCLKDAENGDISKVFLYGSQNEDYLQMDIHFSFRYGSIETFDLGNRYVYARLNRSSANTLRWLSENTDIDLEAIMAYDSLGMGR